MDALSIRVKGISKRYLVQGARRSGARRFRYALLRDRLAAGVTKILRRTSRTSVSGHSGKDVFMALQDVSFDVRPGESVGVIGANGAGKSTLLKILARVTSPTKGRVELRGRVGSLLEVGTGFHNELTGRENVYMNGAVLGMRRREIDRKFDEIVAFSGVEQYIDSPVKFYSTGMRMRLAFSVAAHLEPEILLVDEVLAVGDTAFQEKSLNKMESVTRQGRTVLFVSHNLGAVRALCPRSLVLESGRIVFDGDTSGALQHYLQEREAVAQADRVIDPALNMQVIACRACDSNGRIQRRFPHDQPIHVLLKVQVNHILMKAHVALTVHNSEFSTILVSRDFEETGEFRLGGKTGMHEFLVEIPGNLLTPGKFHLGVEADWETKRGRLQVVDRLEHVAPLDVYDNGSVLARNNMPWQGLVHAPVRWRRHVSPVGHSE